MQCLSTKIILVRKTFLKHCKNHFSFKAATLDDLVNDSKRLDIRKMLI